MLGWMIVIKALTPERKYKWDTEQEVVRLAHWDTNLEGIDWLEELVKEGKAKLVRDDGYPRSYTAKASDVRSILANGIPDYDADDAGIIGPYDYSPFGRTCRVRMDKEKMEACRRNRVLTIEAWDGS